MGQDSPPSNIVGYNGSSIYLHGTRVHKKDISIEQIALRSNVQQIFYLINRWWETKWAQLLRNLSGPFLYLPLIHFRENKYFCQFHKRVSSHSLVISKSSNKLSGFFRAFLQFGIISFLFFVYCLKLHFFFFCFESETEKIYIFF